MIYEKRESISFPIGGIGSGCIGLRGNGALMDFEIFNRPNKNTYNGYTHIAVKAVWNGASSTKVLMGDTLENLSGMHDGSGKHIGFGFGPHTNSMAGYPHFKNVRFDGEFPIAKITFSDPDFPGRVTLTAFNPFIPHDAKNSSIPAAFFEINVENTVDYPVEYSIAFSLCNPSEKSRNESFAKDGKTGVYFRDLSRDSDSIGHTDLCLVTDSTKAHTQEYWYRGRWQDAPTIFWKNFRDLNTLPARTYTTEGNGDHGSVVSKLNIAAGGSSVARFVLSWNCPVQYNYWDREIAEDGKDVTWKNYYATVFKDSKESALYSICDFDGLYRKTREFTDALYSCSLPEAVMDAVAANLSVLKSPTVLRLEDGSFWAWEGCNEDKGSCEGSCQHVWNYAYALPFLFPELERSMRENTFKYAMTEQGSTKFRVRVPLGTGMPTFRSCVDGQMGEVIKCYREYRISGDLDWLKENSENIFKALEYAWSESNPDGWDRDRDGVIEGRQHHTLDMELFGPNSWLEGFYLLALDCGAKIAELIGDDERAEEYRSLYRRGKSWTNENLFNGKCFVQRVDLCDGQITQKYNAPEYWNDEAGEIKYQIGEGCIIDQMLADWHGALIGLDGVFDREKKLVALKTLYENNFKSSMRELTNMWRNFALNDEGGTVICSYPQGVRIPVLPIPYCEECMTGFEYALAGLMIKNGLTDEGEKMVQAVRDRYDGGKRNPWNEIECGSNYARSMASYALLGIYSGFSYDIGEGYIGFAPVRGEWGKYFFSVAESYGTVEISEDSHVISLIGKPLEICAYKIRGEVMAVTVDGKEIEFTPIEDGARFERILVKEKLVVKRKL